MTGTCFDFWVVQHHPDPVTGEFCNVAVIVAGDGQVAHRVLSGHPKAEAVCHTVEGRVDGCPEGSERSIVEAYRRMRHGTAQLSEPRPVLGASVDEALERVAKVMLRGSLQPTGDELDAEFRAITVGDRVRIVKPVVACPEFAVGAVGIVTHVSAGDSCPHLRVDFPRHGHLCVGPGEVRPEPVGPWWSGEEYLAVERDGKKPLLFHRDGDVWQCNSRVLSTGELEVLA